MVRLATVLAVVVGVAGAGCSPDDVETPSYAAGLFPRLAHSGFNKNASFRVMFATSAPDPQWSVGDPTMATITPSAPPTIAGTSVKDLHFALVTATRGGETTVSATSRGATLTARLVIKEYTDEQLNLGKARYTTASPDPTRQPCASCHTKEGGVDHSPLKMAGFDDATIVGVIQNATYPATPTGQSTTSAFSPKGPLKFAGHKWNLSDGEKDGVLAHLRSLPLGGL
jgi:hypothetical protein